MLCNVTGTLYLPNGQLGKSRTLRFKRVDQTVKAEYLGAVVPDDVYTQSDKQGEVDFEILTGVYMMHVEGGYSVRAIVPDAATANIADIIEAAAIPPEPPVWYQQALNARDGALEAADRAEDAAEAAIGSVVADYFVATDAERLALSPSEGETAYVSQTGHTWKWQSGAWVDMGVAPFALESDLALKANQSEVDQIKSAETLVDNSVPLITIGSDDDTQDILRLVPGQHGGLLGNYVTDLQEPAPDDGYILERLNGGALRKLYPDGQDFIPSQKFLDRLPTGGEVPGVPADGWSGRVEGSEVTFLSQAGNHGVSAVDRFRQRGDGVRFPSPIIAGRTRKARIYLMLGQSLADVNRMGDGMIYGRHPLPFHAFMLDDLNTVYAGNPRGGLTGYQGVADPAVSRVVNADDHINRIQTIMGATHARRELLETNGAGPFEAGFLRSAGWGGQRLVGPTAGSGIWKGSTGEYTQAWVNAHLALGRMIGFATAEGFEVDEINVLFEHQQADWQTPYSTYFDQMGGFKSEFDAAVLADHGITPHWFVTQAGGSGFNASLYQGGAWESRLAIADFAADPSSGSNITLVTSRYNMTMGVRPNGTLEFIHEAYKSRILTGEVYAHAVQAVRSEQPWHPARYQSHAVSGNVITVTFNALAPLILDTSFCKVRPDMGFTLTGGIGVADVTVSGSSNVVVTCDADPTGETLNYAWRAQDAEDVSDEWCISTGAVRDMWDAASQFVPGNKLVRPAEAFRVQV